MIHVFLRYDDYSARSAFDVDRGLIDLLRRLGLSCTFAVVPAITSAYPAPTGGDANVELDEERAEMLRTGVQQGTIEIALHGCHHRANDLSPPPIPSEFSRLTAGQQAETLRMGREILLRLAGREPLILVPPWNTYDSNTLEAMKKVGMRVLSAHRYGPAPHGEAGIRLAPMTVEIPGIRKAIDEARELGDESAVLGFVFHPYDFHESGSQNSRLSLDEFEELLSELTMERDVRASCIGQLIAELPSMDSERFKANAPPSIESIFPPFLARVDDDRVYLSREKARRRIQLRIWATFGWYISLGVLAGWIGLLANHVFRELPAFAEMIALGAIPAVVVGLGVRAARRRRVFYKAMTLICALGGFWIGVLAE